MSINLTTLSYINVSRDKSQHHASHTHTHTHTSITSLKYRNTEWPESRIYIGEPHMIL